MPDLRDAFGWKRENAVARKYADRTLGAAIDRDAASRYTQFKKGSATGFALSGGGAKGSFQVGALRFLKEVRGISPDIIAGTSVGAINGCKLAEGDEAPPGYRPGLSGLIDIWNGLAKDTDMAVPISSVAKVLALVTKGGIEDAIKGAVGLEGLKYFASAALAVAAHNAGTASFEDLKALLINAFFSGGLSTLLPVQKLIEDPKRFRPDIFEKSRIEMLICWVGMLSGKTFYVDKKRNLFVAPKFDRNVGSVDSLTDTIIASASIPIIFRSPVVKGTWSGRRFADLGFDGGVTEVAPVEILAARGATQVFALVSSPESPSDLLTGETDAEPDSVFQTYKEHRPGGGPLELEDKFIAELRDMRSLLQIGERALDIVVSETLRDDLRANLKELHVIRPYVAVQGTTEVERGIIQVNQAHGWMCAFDEELRTQPGAHGLNLLHTIARNTNTAITLASRDQNRAIRTQQAIASLIATGQLTTAQLGPLAQYFKQMEVENHAILVEALKQRLDHFGTASFPFTAPGQPDA